MTEVIVIILLIAFAVYLLTRESTIQVIARWVAGISAAVLALILIFL